MVCTVNDLVGWKDFPKGLRVLLLDDDLNSATEIRSKLEEMDYVVSTFGSENEALSAISDKSKGFHVAIVEVRADNKDGRFNFIESMKDLPTIVTSDVNCIGTMMKCIALGAVEYLEKPLSEDKLRNIWQHVAHKAFNAGPKDEAEPLKSERALSGSDVHVYLKKVYIKEDISQYQEHNEEVSVESEKYQAPQVKLGMKLIDNGYHQDQDQTRISTERICVDHDDKSKFVETTCDDLAVDTSTSNTIETDMSKSLETGSGKPLSNECTADHTSNKKRNESSKDPHSHLTKSSRRKIKVDWTAELHKKFVQAVEQLGVDQAIPTRILELMNVPGLTRHNVSSHLQKYRLQSRHILPKDSGRKWPQTRHSTPGNYYLQKPIMAYPPPYHSSHTLPPTQVYPAWPPPHSYAPPPQMYYPAWRSSGNWMWNPYSGVQAWGCPAVLPPCTSFPQVSDSMQSSQATPKHSFDNYPGDEVIDKVVKEAISKPWLPMPLGLRPPSTESVIYELLKQGISTVPHQINGSH